MQPGLQSNIWKYTLAAIANKRIYVAITGAYFLTIEDVTAKIIGIILLSGSLAGFLFEIPSGYVSDKMGHKQALIISRVLLLMSTLFFLWGGHITFLILGSVFLSMGTAFSSGTGSAFMHETLKGLNREKDYSAVMGKIGAIGFSVPIILTALVPFLVNISYKIPFLIMLVLDIIGICTVLSLVSPNVTPEHVEEVRASNFKQVMKEGWKLNFFTVAWMSGIISGLLLTIGGFRAPYQVFLEIPVIWFGIFVGVGRGLASLMMAYSNRIKKHFTFLSFYRFQYLVQIILIISLGLIGDGRYAVIALICISAFQWGLSKIDEGYQLEVLSSSKFKATLLSVGSQMENIVAAISGVGLGFLIDHFSYQLAFLYIGLAAFVILTGIYLHMVRKYKQGMYRFER